MRPGLIRRREGKGNFGSLSAEQIALGLQKTVTSAHDLYQAAKLLTHAGPRATANALLVLAFEEYGKIGWLYYGLMIPPGDRDAWGFFWDGFLSHRLKAEIADEMLRMGDNLLPLTARFFRHDIFRLSATSGRRELHRKAFLYVGFDPARNTFLGPRDYPPNNANFISALERLVSYTAENERAGVFDGSVVAAFQELNRLAGEDEGRRADLLSLFYAHVLRATPLLAGPHDPEGAERKVKEAFGAEADAVIMRWKDIGEALASKRRDM